MSGQRFPSPPPLPNPHVRRPALVRRLSAATVVCVSAPAGYGKTAALTELWGAARGRKLWLAAALDDDGPALAARLYEALLLPPTLIILDNVHLLKEAHWLSDLLAGLSETQRVVMAGRYLPDLPALSRLRLEGRCQEMGAADLALTVEEIGLLLAGLGSTAWDEAALYTQTGGWPAAVRLLAHPDPGVGRRHWAEYLQAEVHGALPPDQQRFAEEASILAEWSAPALDAILGMRDSAARLSALTRTAPLAGNGTDGGLRPHPLWLASLRERLVARPLRRRAIERAAAFWAAGNGQVSAALDLHLAAGDLGAAEPLLRRTCEDLLRAGRLSELDACLQAVPDGMLEGLALLLLRFGEAWHRAGRPSRAVPWLHRAAVGFAGRSDGSGFAVAVCRLALAHLDLGDAAEARAALAQVEGDWADLPPAEQAEVLLALGEELAGTDRGREAADRFRAAHVHFTNLGLSDRAGAALLGLGARALPLLGEVPEALEVLRGAEALVSGAFACEVCLAQTELLILMEQWGEAAAIAELTRPASPPQEARLAYLQAHLALRRGDLFMAERLCRSGDLTLAETDRTPALQACALAVRAMVEQASGQRHAAQSTARRAVQAAAGAGAPLARLMAGSVQAQAGDATTQASGAVFQVDLLGGVRVRTAGGELPVDAWGRAQARGLFLYLLLRPGFGAARDELLDAFWPDQSPQQSRSVLRATLYRVRKVLRAAGADLDADSDFVRLPTGAVGWVDVLAFRRSLAVAKRALSLSPPECLEHCRNGYELYGGEVAAGSDWPWLASVREQVRHERQELLLLWSEAARQAGKPDEAAFALRELRELDPSNEEATCRLMELLEQTGRRAEAARAYRELTRYLRRELGLSPSAETQALLARILG